MKTKISMITGMMLKPMATTRYSKRIAQLSSIRRAPLREQVTRDLILSTLLEAP
jgi:hypothetical protein